MCTVSKSEKRKESASFQSQTCLVSHPGERSLPKDSGVP